MAKAAKKKSAKEASNIFHNIMQASVKGNPTPDIELGKVKNEFLKRVEGEPISKDWPNHLIYDIQILNSIPYVMAMNKLDNTLLKKPLQTWLTDNGY